MPFQVSTTVTKSLKAKHYQLEPLFQSLPQSIMIELLGLTLRKQVHETHKFLVINYRT